MSRLAFDDIFKPSPSLGPSDSRASQRSSKKTGDVSLFDNKFKQAVKELNANDSSDFEEKFDPKTSHTETSADPSKKRESQDSAPNAETVTSDQKTPENANDESVPSSSDIDESPLDPTAESGDQEGNKEDALIAQVMAEAVGHEKGAALLGDATEGETTSDNTSATVSTDNLTDLVTETDATGTGTANASQEVEASVVTTDETLNATSTEATASGEQIAPQANLVSSKNVIPQEAEARSEADAESKTTSGNLTPGASAAINAQQNSSDTNQDAEGGESETSQNPQASTLNPSAAEGEELPKKETAATTTTKVETLQERSTAAMGQETRPAQGSSNNPTQQTTEPTVDTADRVRFVERVAQAFKAQSNENGTIRMRLSPEELGSLRIEITIRNGTMHARVETETQEARNILMDNLPALRDRLATHNIKVEQFEIDYNAGGDQQNLPHAPEDWTDSGRNGSNDSNGNLSSEEVDATETSTRQAASVTGSGEQLDVIG